MIPVKYLVTLNKFTVLLSNTPHHDKELVGYSICDTFKNMLLAICLPVITNSESSEVSLEPITIDIDEILTDEPVYFSKLFSGFKIIPLENNEDCMFSIITNIKLTDDKIYVFDRIYTKGFFAFTKQGEFLYRVGEIGRGPGEYIQASDIDIDPVSDNAYVFDWNNKKLSVYDSKGDYRHSIKVGDYFRSLFLIAFHFMTVYTACKIIPS